MEKQLRRDDIIEVDVTDLTFEGQAVGRSGGMVVFVRGAVPGDSARVRLSKIKHSFAEGQAVQITRPSAWRVAARCEHFGVCGGCISQDLDYPQQLEFKRRNVSDALKRIGGLRLDVLPTLGMPEPWRYRNKMEFAFGEQAGNLYLGLMRRGAYDEVVPINLCHLATERAMLAVRSVEDWARRRGLHAFEPHARSGSLRHLVIREGRRSGELLINLVTTSHTAPDLSLLDALAPVQPATVLWSHNDTWGAVVRGEIVHTLAGTGEITERIGHLRLFVGPFSFLQTNSDMVETLYDEIARQAALSGAETVLDLYCGVGSIALYLARRARRVTGIEVVAEAIESARRNAAVNDINNAEFQCAAVEALSILSLGAVGADVVVLDPPRAGLHPRLLATLRELKAPRVVYVSCNPAALARDLKALGDLYTFGQVQPVDMFPHTWHIESVVTLSLI